MIAAALLLAAQPQTAVAAECAFATMAQRRGQRTAFRAYAAPDAVMFDPQPIDVQATLKGRADPPSAVMWWPAESWLSCDGRVAVNLGPWVRAGGRSVGYFTTVWLRRPDGGWKWIYDGGDTLPHARAAGDAVKTVRARCAAAAAPKLPPSAGMRGEGAAPDGSLRWAWTVAADGTRRFAVTLAGRRKAVVDQTIAP